MTSIAALTIKKACSEKKRKSIDEYADKYADIPLVGRTVFEQQRLLYRSLLEWLDEFESQYKRKLIL